MSCSYAPGKHVWIDKTDLIVENGRKGKSNGRGVPPHSVIRTINVMAEASGEYVSIPLSQRLPYQIDQTMNPNRIKLRIFGATADTDWVSDVPQLRELIDSVVWSQIGDNQYEVQVNLKGNRQWGYKADYNGTELRLHVRKPPEFVPQGRLDGITICLDPGHGGRERGAIGPSGVAEADVNLAIALKLQSLLAACGARVIMTRTTDQDISLFDRVKFAEANDANLLLSVHNNSLPDGRDPWVERGSSTYWYHPQSKELAGSLENGLVATMHFVDLGNRFQNLALARTSWMPAALAEVGFMINPDEYAFLITEAGQESAAQGLMKGIKDYLSRSSGL
jgi:N-acetylmuramoyl-L-alanine amidase